MNKKLADLGRQMVQNIDPSMSYTFEAILNDASDDGAFGKVNELDAEARRAFAVMATCSVALAARKDLDTEAFGLLVNEAMMGYMRTRNILPQSFNVIGGLQQIGLLPDGCTDIKEPAWFAMVEKPDGGDVGV